MKSFTLFEGSWEVCNKVGGIYTVVKSKADVANKNFENYFLVGPYIENNPHLEFEDKVAPEKLKKVFAKLKNEGIICHYGDWNIPGKPNVILINFDRFSNKVNDYKKLFWEKYGVDSFGSDFIDYDQPLIWSIAVAKLVELYSQENQKEKVIFHAHEWLTGGGILYLDSVNSNVKTVFTTHATMLGRTLAGNEIDFYNDISALNPPELAYKYGCQTKHLTEKACASKATIFTTVSEITGMEAEHFYERKPDVLLPNGLDISKFPTFEEESIAHKRYKSRFRDFCQYFFFPHYSFDIKNTLIFFTAARNEFHGKGLDTLIYALSDLDKKMKSENINKTVVTFFFIPIGNQGMHMEVLENKTYFEDIKDSILSSQRQLLAKIAVQLISDQKISKETLFSNEQLIEFSGKIKRFKSSSVPLFSTHHVDYDNEPICNAFVNSGLINSKENRVKVVLYPIYLTGADSLLDLGYYQAIQGAHLGIFPSYYEPWGYTPLETNACGVSSLTTDLAGFGRYLETKFDKAKLKGSMVINRLNVDDTKFVKSLSKSLLEYVKLDKKGRIKRKMLANELANSFDWKHLISQYVLSYDKALKK
jgi:glycogen synthase